MPTSGRRTLGFTELPWNRKRNHGEWNQRVPAEKWWACEIRTWGRQERPGGIWNFPSGSWRKGLRSQVPSRPQAAWAALDVSARSAPVVASPPSSQNPVLTPSSQLPTGRGHPGLRSQGGFSQRKHAPLIAEADNANSGFQPHVFPVSSREDLVVFKKKKKKAWLEKKETWTTNGYISTYFLFMWLDFRWLLWQLERRGMLIISIWISQQFSLRGHGRQGPGRSSPRRWRGMKEGCPTWRSPRSGGEANHRSPQRLIIKSIC